MLDDSKKQANKHASIRDIFYIPLLILRIIVLYWYGYLRLQLVGLVIVLIWAIFNRSLFTLDGLYFSGAIVVLYLGIYFFHLLFERYDG